ncbi:MAG: hypothetical protein P4M09_16730 [Devosia sp.]|nr:hypothetical protein [Devosia sp.]
MADPVIKKIPMGVRALAPPTPKGGKERKVNAETCGHGAKNGRAPRLDEIDREWS